MMLGFWLCDRVFPAEAPMRQWVLSLSYRLRVLCAYDADACAAVRRILVRTVSGLYEARARRLGLPRPRPRTGAVAFVQRFDSGLRLNVHYHVAWLDGVFAHDLGGAPSGLPPATTGPRPAVAYDYEHDGDADLIAPSVYLTSGTFQIVTGSLENALLRNTGTAWSAAPDATTNLPQPSPTAGAATYVLDIDGDGHVDIVRAPGLGQAAGAILLGDGNGGFAPVPAGDFGMPSARASGLAFGDFDGDGDLDIACTFRQEPYVTNPFSKLFRNDVGVFHEQPFPPLYAEQIVAGDFDGDSDLDLVLDGFLADVVLRNDGNGVFTELPGALPAVVDPQTPNLIAPLQACDLDGDGALDLAA